MEKYSWKNKIFLAALYKVKFIFFGKLSSLRKKGAYQLIWYIASLKQNYSSTFFHEETFFSFLVWLQF